MVEVLNPPRFQPLPVEEQVAQIFAGAEGYLDEVPVERVREFLSGLRDHLRAHHADVLEKLAAVREITDEVDEGLRAGIEEFRRGFAVDSGQHEVPGSRADTAAGADLQRANDEAHVAERAAEEATES